MSHISSWCKGIKPQKSFHWKMKSTYPNWNKDKNAAVVTTGGNCPGINYVLYNLEKELPRKLLFFENGFDGLNRDLQVKVDTEESVLNIGSAIGMSRKHIDVKNSIKTLQNNNVSNLYIIGGNGSSVAACLIHNEIVKLNLPICVNLIPKTIDNDIPMIQKSFGFDSAVDQCSLMINSAYSEAKLNNEISIIQLMGRKSGALSLYSSYGANHYDILLIPEHPVEHCFVRKRIEEIYKRNKNVTIVLAEGYVPKGTKRQSNYVVKLYNTCQMISSKPKLFIPNYLCRNTTVCTSDKIFIKQLVKHSVFASEHGYGGSCIGMYNNTFILANLNEMRYRKKELDMSDPLFAQYVNDS